MEATASSPHTLPLFHQAEDWFRRARASLLGQIPCGRGCCDCCTGIFPITRLDALEIQRGLDELPSALTHAIVTRARTQITAMETAYPRLKSTPGLDEWADDTIDEMAERFAHLPCPALEADGTCSIYSHRPITCRTMGIPSESDGIVHGACAVQTAVPIVRLSATLRRDADRLAEHEALSLSILRRAQPPVDDEILLPYGFVPNGDPTP